MRFSAWGSQLRTRPTLSSACMPTKQGQRRDTRRLLVLQQNAAHITVRPTPPSLDPQRLHNP